MPSYYLPVMVILLFGAFASVILKKLTALAGFTGFVVGLLVFIAAGYTGVSMLGAFFISATIATSLGINQKHQKDLAENNKGKRTAGQVIANAGVAAVLSLFATMAPQHILLIRIMIAASLASATADTLSSELGNLYGKKFYNIITLTKDTRGLNGVISLEGTMWGLGGSISIALIYLIGFGFYDHLLLIVVAGTIGNLSDSILGATLERWRYINNNAVNLFNTAIAAGVVYIIYLLK